MEKMTELKRSQTVHGVSDSFGVYLLARSSVAKRAICLSVLLGFTAFFQGCSLAKGYHGPTMDSSKLAVLRGHGVTIHQVNDVEIGATAPGILVPAGTNKIYLSINVSNFNSPEDSTKLRELTVDIDAEKEYVITGQRGDGRVCAWPVSTTTGDPEFTSPAGCL